MLAQCRHGEEGGVEVQSHSFLTSALDGVDGTRHVMDALPRCKGTHTYFRASCVGPCANLDGCEEDKVSCPYRSLNEGRVSSVGIATRYGLDGPGTKS